MNDYILLMHGDAREFPPTDTDAAWGRYVEALTKSGRFSGGSAIGSGKCFTSSGTTREITSHISGYISGASR